MRFYLFLFMFLYLFGCPTVYSQQSNIKFRNLSTEHGLSQSNVICIIQDSNGFMWFGTRYGLNKYDGYNFSIYKKNQHVNSISNNTIMGLLEGSDGNLWIATWGGGINKFDPKKEKFTHYKALPNQSNGLSDNFVNVIYEDKKGNLWIGTNSGGLNLFDREQNTFKTFVHDKNNPKSIGSNSIYAIYEDSRNNLWIGTETGGLNLFNPETQEFQRFQHDPNNNKSISHNFARKIIEDKKGNIWIGTYGGGVNLLNSESKEFRHFKKDKNNSNSLSHNFIFSLEEDVEGNIWIGTENGGLSIFEPKEEYFQNYFHSNTDKMSLSSNSVYSIYKDNKGNIWIGTFSGGIDLYSIDSKKFNHFKNNSSQNSLSDNNVLCIIGDSEENIWIGTDGGGLNHYDPIKKKFTHFIHDEKNKKSIGGNYVLGIHEDSEKNIWVGTWGGGVTVFNKNKNVYQHFRHDPTDPTSLGSNNGWVIFEDKDKDIWIGTFYGGLNLYNKKTKSFSKYTFNPNDDSTISSNNIYTIFQDSKDNLWIGTDGGGLNLFNKKTGKFLRYTHKEDENSLSNNSVSCIFEDADGILWISTDAGLNKFDPVSNSFIVYKEDDGLPNDMVFGILEDNNKNLWLSTNRGLSKFDPKTLQFKNYLIADGLQHNEFKRQAFFKAKSGLMYFGGINGFNEFHPESVIEKSFNPPIVFTGFQLFNKNVPIADEFIEDTPLTNHINFTNEIVLSHKQSVLSIEFAILNYTVEEKKKYAYILEGFDKEWNEVGTKRTTSYTNLEPGKYVFKVKGLNNEGEWSDNMAILNMTIIPPFWKTWWFRIIVITIILGSFFTLYHTRINIIKRQKVALEKQVQERTAEVVMQKEEIVAQSEKLEDLYIEVRDSIRAAQNIQQSILPDPKFIRKFLPQSFVLNMPKDVVSGDFYWFDVVNEQIVVAVVDCTGHGVSGAFMSINGHHLLNQSIFGHEKLIASEILNRLNKGIIKELRQEDESSKTIDGMDISLCIIDKNMKRMQYAGANNPLYLIRENKLIQTKANRFSVGLSVTGKIFEFNNNEVEIQQGDTIYLFSDGYADQIGGIDRKSKFMYSKFRDLLLNIHMKDMDQQANDLEVEINKWRGSNDQLDDIMIIGFKV